VAEEGGHTRWSPDDTVICGDAMEEHEALAAASAHPLLALLEPKVLESVVKNSRIVTYRLKRTIIKEGDLATHAYCLLSGAVRVYHRSQDGESEVLVKLFRAPALFGEMEVLAQRPFLEYVTTIDYSTILQIPAELFHKLVRTSPRFSQSIAVDLAARLCIATHNERALAFCDVETRLANLLLDYAQFFGEPQSDGSVRLTVALSQESMARDLAVSRKSLTRSLLKLKREGILTKANARYVLRDVDAIKKRSSNTLGLNYRIDWQL
jgi:CRP/FNR family transcriptional regulator, cyclic AMP receptor protein